MEYLHTTLLLTIGAVFQLALLVARHLRQPSGSYNILFNSVYSLFYTATAILYVYVCVNVLNENNIHLPPKCYSFGSVPLGQAASTSTSVRILVVPPPVRPVAPDQVRLG